MCAEYGKRSSLNSQRNWRNVCDYFDHIEILHFDNELFIWAPKTMGHMVMDMAWNWKPSHTNYVFHNLHYEKWVQSLKWSFYTRLPYMTSHGGQFNQHSTSN